MDSRCLSQLRQAVSNGNTDVIKQLLGEAYIYAHHDASAAGMLEQLLTAHEGQIPGRSVLQTAAEQGRTDIVCLLLSAGAPIDPVDLGSALAMSPLHYAARPGHVDVVQLLISAGANLEQKNYQQRTPLAEAAEHAQVHVVQALLQAGAAAHTVYLGGTTPLIRLAEDIGNVQSDDAACRTAELLVAAGAAVNAKDEHCYTALHHAAYHASPCRVSIVQMLGSRCGYRGHQQHRRDPSIFSGRRFAATGGWLAAVRWRSS
jgi:ankyrin repeat protein